MQPIAPRSVVCAVAALLGCAPLAYAQMVPATQTPISQQPGTPATPPATGPTSTPTAKSPTGSPTPDAGAPSQADLAKAKADAAKNADTIPSVGEDLDTHIKKGSENDVDAIGTRNIGGRGLGNWYSTNWEVSTGKQYSMEIEKSAHMITDPVVAEYVNRIGQNIVKNSDCKVPFTIRVIDSDEINAMALPGGFYYVNSGLILAADEEAELAGVMARGASDDSHELCADRPDSADHPHPGLVDRLRHLRGFATSSADWTFEV
jgi:hypothetical protein